MIPVNRTLPREHVVQTLAAAIATHPLTAVVAPVGFGKTVSAEKLCRQHGSGAYRVSIPPGRYDTACFYNVLISHLRRLGLSTGITKLTASIPASPALAMENMKSLGKESPLTLLVLDDYHHIGNHSVDTLIAALARTPDLGFSIVLFSRTVPDAPLDVQTLGERFVRFGPELLALTEEETVEYLMPDSGEGAFASEAWHYCGGWPAGLWLACSHRRETGSFKSALDSDSPFAKAIFSSFSPKEMERLRQLALVGTFTGKEAAWLIGDKDTLSGLDTHPGIAVLCALENGQYRMYEIFRDCLLGDSSITRMPNAATVQRRAGEYMVQRGDLIDAFRLYRQASAEMDQASALTLFLHAGGEKMAATHFEEIRLAVQEMPWSVRLLQPFGYLAFIWFSHSIGNDQLTATILDEAAEQFSNTSSLTADLRRRLVGETEFVRALCQHDRIGEVWSGFTNALYMLHGRSHMCLPWLSWNFRSPHFSFLCVGEPGGYTALVDNVSGASGILAILSNGEYALMERVFLLERSLERGDLLQARALLAEVENRAGNDVQAGIIAAFARSRLLLAEGEYATATAPLDSMRAEIEKADLFSHAVSLDLALAYTSACLGRSDRVPAWLGRGEHFSIPNHAALCPWFFTIVYCKTLLADSQYANLYAAVRSLPSRMGRSESLLGRIHIKVLEAISAWQAHSQTDAITSFREALELARKDGLVLSIAEYGKHVFPLLRQLRLERPDDEHIDRVAALTRMYMDIPGVGKNGSNELTAGEKEMMRLVSQGLSNAGIAEKMSVSSVWVDKTLSHVYGKLGAANRAEAAHLFVARYGGESNSLL